METRHRGMLGGGPASQHPRSQSHQIRRPMPRARHGVVIALSTVVMHFDGLIHRNTAHPAPSAARASCLTLPERARSSSFQNHGADYLGVGEGPLIRTDAPCPARQRGLSRGNVKAGALSDLSDNRGDGAHAFRVRDAERSDAVDGFHHQFSRAGPDLGLRHAQLSVVRCRAVLDRLGVCRLGRRGVRDAARGFPGFAAAAAVCRHRVDPGDLPRRDGDPEILQPAGVMAPHRADHRLRLRRPVVLHLRLRQRPGADDRLYDRAGAADGAEPEIAVQSARGARQSRRPAGRHRHRSHPRHFRHPAVRRADQRGRRVLLHAIHARCNRWSSWCWCSCRWR